MPPCSPIKCVRKPRSRSTRSTTNASPRLKANSGSPRALTAPGRDREWPTSIAISGRSVPEKAGPPAATKATPDRPTRRMTPPLSAASRRRGAAARPSTLLAVPAIAPRARRGASSRSDPARPDSATCSYTAANSSSRLPRSGSGAPSVRNIVAASRSSLAASSACVVIFFSCPSVARCRRPRRRRAPVLAGCGAPRPVR